MKNLFLVLSFFLFIIILIPVLIIRSCSITPQPETKHAQKGCYETVVYKHKDGLTENLDLEEYIKGVVAAEMPASFHSEALKAQAVAARTYTVKRMSSLGGSPNIDHPEVDICTDSTHCQAWISDKDFKEKLKPQFGLFNYKRYLNNVYEAVDDTQGLILTYSGEIIDPLFHSTSGGFTEDSEQVFLTKVPYLRSVPSPYEEHSPKLTHSLDIGVAEFVRILKQRFDGLNIEAGDIPSAINVLETSGSGKIMSLRIGNRVVRGRDVREALGLNSTDFKIERAGDIVTITTVGYGHGVGMSQYGADGMAKRGHTFEDILKLYYTGTELKTIEEVCAPGN